MDIEGLNRVFEEHPFFRELDPKWCQFIADCAANERFDADTYILREGEAANKFYLLRHGTVALEIYDPARKALVIETLSEGDILGWSWLVPPYRWRFDARAIELTRAVSLDAKCLRSKMEQNHELAYQLYQRFMPMVAQRLEALRLQLTDMYGVPKDSG